jgi:glycogen operon protein
VNFVACHDGFTLHDLVSYNEKHNEANLEGNRDGENHNHSWNHGVEGPTDDAGIRALRERQKRNMLATVLLSQGVPMLYAGDEMGHTQQGNNNAYCQDNDISWLQWDLAPDQRDLLAFVRYMVALRRAQPVLKRRRFFQGRSIRGGHVKDITWFEPGGAEMSDAFWASSHARSLGVRLVGTQIEEVDQHGNPIVGDTLFMMFSASTEPTTFALPVPNPGEQWERVLDTALRHWSRRMIVPEREYPLAPRALAVFRIVAAPNGRGDR